MNDIIKAITDFIFVEDKPEPADAIIVVGGSAPELSERAAELWKMGYAKYVFVGGKYSIKKDRFPGPASKRDVYNKDYATEYMFERDVLLKCGVAESAIIGEERSTFTRENAVFAKEAFDVRGIKIKKALLVCKSFHARRALMFFSSAFNGVEFIVVPVIVSVGENGTDYEAINKLDWYKSEAGINKVLGELSRCGSQFGVSDIASFIKSIK